MRERPCGGADAIAAGRSNKERSVSTRGEGKESRAEGEGHGEDEGAGAGSSSPRHPFWMSMTGMRMRVMWMRGRRMTDACRMSVRQV